MNIIFDDVNLYLDGHKITTAIASNGKIFEFPLGDGNDINSRMAHDTSVVANDDNNIFGNKNIITNSTIISNGNLYVGDK